MGAGQSIASEELESTLLEETGSADFEDRFLQRDFERDRDSSARRLKKPPAASRLQHKTKESL
jgi:hypothetical protein